MKNSSHSLQSITEGGRQCGRHRSEDSEEFRGSVIAEQNIQEGAAGRSGGGQEDLPSPHKLGRLYRQSVACGEATPPHQFIQSAAYTEERSNCKSYGSAGIPVLPLPRLSISPPLVSIEATKSVSMEMMVIVLSSVQ